MKNIFFRCMFRFVVFVDRHKMKFATMTVVLAIANLVLALYDINGRSCDFFVNIYSAVINLFSYHLFRYWTLRPVEDDADQELNC